MSDSLRRNTSGRYANPNSGKPKGRGNGIRKQKADDGERQDDRNFDNSKKDALRIEDNIKKTLSEGGVISIKKFGKNDVLSFVIDFADRPTEAIIQTINAVLEKSKEKIGDQYSRFMIDIDTINSMVMNHYGDMTVAASLEKKNKMKKILGKIDVGQKVDIIATNKEFEDGGFSDAFVRELTPKLNKLNKSVEKLDNQMFSTLMTILMKSIPNSRNRAILVQKFDECRFFKRMKEITKNGINSEGYDLLSVYFWARFTFDRQTPRIEIDDWVAAANLLIEKIGIDVAKRNSKGETSRDSYIAACEKGFATYCEEMSHVLAQSFAVARRDLWVDIIDEALAKITSANYKTFSDGLKLVLIKDVAKITEKNIVVNLKPGVSLITEFVNRVIQRIVPFMGNRHKLFYVKAFHYLNNIFMSIGSKINTDSYYYDLLKEDFGNDASIRTNLNVLKASLAENIKNRFSKKFLDIAQDIEDGGAYPEELNLYSVILGCSMQPNTESFFNTIPMEKYRETLFDGDPDFFETINFFMIYPFLFQFYATICSCVARVLKHTLPDTGVTDVKANSVLIQNMNLGTYIPKMISAIEQGVKFPADILMLFPEILSDFLVCDRFDTLDDYLNFKPTGKLMTRQIIQENEKIENDKEKLEDEWKPLVFKNSRK